MSEYARAASRPLHDHEADNPDKLIRQPRQPIPEKRLYEIQVMADGYAKGMMLVDRTTILARSPDEAARKYADLFVERGSTPVQGH
jgi:hypothetical protein